MELLHRLIQFALPFVLLAASLLVTPRNLQLEDVNAAKGREIVGTLPEAEYLNIYRDSSASGTPNIIQVTTTADELNNDGDCSLREAVQASNTDTAVDACPAGSAEDAINLPAGTYTLSIGSHSEDGNAEGDLDVSGNLNIAGAGADTTIIQAGPDRAGGIDRLFHVLGYGNLILQNVTLRYGRVVNVSSPHGDGGGIYVASGAQLTVDNCVLTDLAGSETGGIHVADSGQLTVSNSLLTHISGVNTGAVGGSENSIVEISDSTIADNTSDSVGGGLRVSGTTVIDNVTFDANVGAFGGGAVAAGGETLITNSTFSHNMAPSSAPLPEGHGGAIYSYSGMIIENSTFSGNYASGEGGGIDGAGELTIISSTFTDNTAAIAGGIQTNGSSTKIANTIIANNTDGNCAGSFTSLGYNIDSDGSCGLASTGDQAKTDPYLDALRDNGGPTRTHALLLDSPAIDAGDPAGCTGYLGAALGSDQRGVSRVGRCDIGAYEYDPADPPALDFTGTPLAGKNPLAVQFKNLSSGDQSSCLWDFGDGNTSTDCNDPHHTYSSSGLFTVSFAGDASGASETITKQDYVLVFDPPIADFEAPPFPEGPEPLSVSFTNLSSGDFDECLWDFGDGDTSADCSGQNHIYRVPEEYDGDIIWYTPSLTVTGPGGSDTKTRVDYVFVLRRATADFNGSPTSGVRPLTVDFTNLSTGYYLSCLWDFGDGQTSNKCAGPHTYNASGTYTVELLVYYMDGDEITKENYITVFEPANADFIASPASGVSPTIVAFTNLSTGDFDQCLWDFGDGGTSADCNDPSHTYSAQGKYTVTLTLDGPGGSAVKTRTDYLIILEPVSADFSVTPTNGVAPLDVKFSNLSSGDYAQCLWDFGDNSTSTICGDPAHTYSSPGTFTISLSLDGPGGKDETAKTNFVTAFMPSEADFSVSPNSGLPPLSVNFTNLSTGDFDQCLWDFGDGGASNECDNPAHTYADPGLFTVSLTLEGLGGEDELTRTDFIAVFEPPEAKFSASPSSGLPPLSVNFTNLSTGDFDQCLWDFGDGDTSSDCSDLAHTYKSPGEYSVSLEVRGDGGQDMLSKVDFISVYEPVTADFSVSTERGAPPLMVDFTNLSNGDFNNCIWDFGDGAQFTGCGSVSHMFYVEKLFTIALTVTGPGGEDTKTVVQCVHVAFYRSYMPGVLSVN